MKRLHNFSSFLLLMSCCLAPAAADKDRLKCVRLAFVFSFAVVTDSDISLDMSVEGIFRKNGNIRRLNELTDAIDRDPSSVDLTQDNPVQLAALLKKFLKSLPEPLMTYKLYRLFMAAESKKLCHLVIVKSNSIRNRFA